jgi:hypothetical protein
VSLIDSIVQISLISTAIIPIFDMVKQIRLLFRGKNVRSAPILTLS